MKPTLKAITLSTLIVTGLVACDDDSGGQSPAKLATTDEAAFFYSGFFYGLKSTELSSLAFDRTNSVGEAAAACSTSGSASYTADTATATTEDGRITFAQCVDQQDNETQTLDGSIELSCPDLPDSSNNCRVGTFRFGEGADGRKPLKGTFKNDSLDYSYSSLFDYNRGEGTATARGVLVFADNLQNFRLTLGLDTLQTDGSFTGDASGRYGISTSSRQCPSGTVMPSGNLGLDDGDLTLTGADGRSATFSRNSDNTVLVTLNDGTTHTYLHEDLAIPQNFCAPAS